MTHLPFNHTWSALSYRYVNIRDLWGSLSRVDTELFLMCPCGKAKFKRIAKAELHVEHIEAYARKVYNGFLPLEDPSE